MKEDIKRLGGLHPFASEPPAAPLPRHSEAGFLPPHHLGGAHKRGAPYSSHRAPFWYSRRRGLRPRCVGQYQLSFFRWRAGSPPLRLTSLMRYKPPIASRSTVLEGGVRKQKGRVWQGSAASARRIERCLIARPDPHLSARGENGKG